MTAQDQQSRAEFEAHMRKLSPCVRLYRHTCDGGDKYRTVTVQRNWELWQAARAMPGGVEPVGEVLSSRPCNDTSTIDKALPTGTKLYTAAQVLAMGRVPPGWEITEEMHIAAVKVLHRAAGVDGLPQRMVDAMLAAAPRPPAAP